MKIKRIWLILIILGIIAFLAILPGLIFMSSEDMFIEVVDDENISDSSNQDKSKISANGTLTSFNIEELQTEYWTKIEEELVKNEEIVKPEQKLLKVKNDMGTGEIYSTIGGKFFIEENGMMTPKNSKYSYYIYDLDNIGIEIVVDEDEAPKISLGQKANITFNGISDKFEGRVYYIQKVPNNEEVKVKVKMEFSDTLKFGCEGKVEILLDEPIDENVKEFDVKNMAKRIGKTKMFLNNSENMELSIEDILANYDFDLDSDDLPIEIFDYDGNELSIYWYKYWEEYWNEIIKENEEDFNRKQKRLDEKEKQINEKWNKYWEAVWRERFKEEYAQGEIIEPNTDSNDKYIKGE